MDKHCSGNSTCPDQDLSDPDERYSNMDNLGQSGLGMGDYWWTRANLTIIAPGRAVSLIRE